MPSTSAMPAAAVDLDHMVQFGHIELGASCILAWTKKEGLLVDLRRRTGPVENPKKATPWQSHQPAIDARPMPVRSSYRHVAWYVTATEYHLPEVQTARPECASRAEQVIAPHPVKAFVETFLLLQFGPGSNEVRLPGHQRAVIVRAEIMPILKNEQIPPWHASAAPPRE